MGGVIPAGAATGQTLYGQIRSAADATVANGAGLEAYNLSHWGNYTIAMPEQSGSGIYILTVPGYLAAGRYFVIPFVQLGVSPAAGDTPVDILFFDWDGGNTLGLGSALNIGKINGVAQAAVNLGVAASQYVIGAAAAGTLTTQKMTTNLGGSQANLYTGRTVYFTSGANVGRAALITAYQVAGGLLTFIGYGNQPINVAPTAGDTFLIV